MHASQFELEKLIQLKTAKGQRDFFWLNNLEISHERGLLFTKMHFYFFCYVMNLHIYLLLQKEM